MSAIAFLQNIKVAAAEVKPTSTRSTAKKQRQPDNADIRIWKDGSVYPSDALIKKFGLEYEAKNEDGSYEGRGFDIAEAMDMPKQILGVTQNFLVIGAIDRNLPKVDLFASCTYKDGLPVTTVAEQGAFSYGEKVFLPLLKEVYNVEPNEEGFIDLSIVFEGEMAAPNDIYNIPKKVARGERAGTIITERRENMILYPLVPTSMTTSNEVPAEDTTIAGESENQVYADGSVAYDQAERAEPIDYSTDEHLVEETTDAFGN